MRTKQQIKEELKSVKAVDWEEYYKNLSPEELKLYKEIFEKQQEKYEK